MKNIPYIAVDGGEGSGKTSLMKELAKVYGDQILLTREPGGSPDGKVIRRLALTHPLAKFASTDALLYLMFADRYDHVEKVIEPALLAGKPVITDRSDLSTYAYQVIAGGDQRQSAYWDLREKLPRLPDLYVVMDVDPEIGLKRRGSAGDVNHLDQRPLEFHQKVRQGLLSFGQNEAVKQRIVVIDANRPFEEVKSEFLQLIKTEIGE